MKLLTFFTLLAMLCFYITSIIDNELERRTFNIILKVYKIKLKEMEKN